MQRPIKFRIWTGLEMLDWERAWNTECKLPEYSGKGKYLSIAIIAMMTQGNNGLTALQFTGLLDKNNKEIYEGDILKIHDVCGLNNNTYIYKEVKFGNGQYDGRYYPYVGFYIDKENSFINALLFKSDSIEVIGDAFENPELLN